MEDVQQGAQQLANLQQQLAGLQQEAASKDASLAAAAEQLAAAREELAAAAAEAQHWRGAAAAAQAELGQLRGLQTQLAELQSQHDALQADATDAASVWQKKHEVVAAAWAQDQEQLRAELSQQLDEAQAQAAAHVAALQQEHRTAAAAWAEREQQLWQQLEEARSQAATQPSAQGEVAAHPEAVDLVTPAKPPAGAGLHMSGGQAAAATQPTASLQGSSAALDQPAPDSEGAVSAGGTGDEGVTLAAQQQLLQEQGRTVADLLARISELEADMWEGWAWVGMGGCGWMCVVGHPRLLLPTHLERGRGGVTCTLLGSMHMECLCRTSLKAAGMAGIPAKALTTTCPPFITAALQLCPAGPRECCLSAQPRHEPGRGQGAAREAAAGQC